MGFLKSVLGNKEENKFVEDDERIRAYRKCEHLAYELCRIDMECFELSERLEEENPDKTKDECYHMACEAFEDEKLKAVTEALMISLSETHQKEHEYNVNALVNGEELLWKPIGFDLFMSDVCEGPTDESGIDFCVKTIFEESGELVEGLSKERIRKEIVDSFNKYGKYFDFLYEESHDGYDFSDEDAEFIPVCLACGSLLGDGIYSECVACGEIPMKWWLGIEDDAVCPNCGEPLQEGASFCGKCGTRVDEERYCTNCGAKIEWDAKFCSKCGTAV